MPIFRVKSVKIYTGQKNLHWRCQWRQWQLSGMHQLGLIMVIMIMKMVTTRPFYPPAGLHQLGANHCPGFGPAPQSGIWSKHYFLGKLTQELVKLGTPTITMNNHLLKDKNTKKKTLWSQFHRHLQADSSWRAHCRGKPRSLCKSTAELACLREKWVRRCQQ